MHKRGACAWAPRFIDYFIVKWYNIVALLAEYFSKEVVDVADSNQENTLESAQRDISNAVKMGAVSYTHLDVYKRQSPSW